MILRPDRSFPLSETDEQFGARFRPFIRFTHRAKIAHAGGERVVELRTDDPHLAEFFRQNWSAASGPDTPHGVITALKHSATVYGLTARHDGVRWYDRADRHVVCFANSAYANVKITVRGLCSQDGDAEEMWLHGCALSIRAAEASRGLMLLGRSGGGKTTITAELRRRFGNGVKVTNDDWGSFSPATRRAYFTGERLLHMKYLSVSTLRPDLAPDADSHLSEHFSGDRRDPIGRLLISPTSVFGEDGFAEEMSVDTLVLIRRATGITRGVRRLHPDDALELIDRGEFSDYYGQTERFFNGSLFLAGEDDVLRHRAQVRRLLDTVEIIELGNSGPISLVVDEMLEYFNSNPLKHALPMGRS